MRDVLLNCALVLVFVLVGGFFAAAEMALISLRDGQVRALSERGRRGRKVAHLTASPNRFLAAVQIGVTLAGFLSAAVGGATLGDELAPVLEDAGLSSGLADALALVGVTLVIAYFSLVLGELAPKRLALQRAEGIALASAGVLDRMATLSRPVIWLLSVSTDVVVRLLGGNPSAKREAITEEELRDLVAAHESLTKDERKLIDEVFAAGERQLREVMIPRTEVEFLDASFTPGKAGKLVTASAYSRFPVIRGSADEVAGFVHVRDLLTLPPGAKRGTRVGDLVRDIAMFPETRKVLSTLSEMRREGQHIAVVVDEYGGTAGIVTLEDLIEELIGDIRDEYDKAEDATLLRGGQLEVDGLLNLDEFREQTGLELPEGPYETVAGAMMAVLGRLPKLGDTVEVGPARLQVTAMDGRRVARVRVVRLAAPGAD